MAGYPVGGSDLLYCSFVFPAFFYDCRSVGFFGGFFLWNLDCAWVVAWGSGSCKGYFGSGFVGWQLEWEPFSVACGWFVAREEEWGCE